MFRDESSSGEGDYVRHDGAFWIDRHGGEFVQTQGNLFWVLKNMNGWPEMIISDSD